MPMEIPMLPGVFRSVPLSSQPPALPSFFSIGAQAGNVYWAVGTFAMLGADSLFIGNILLAVTITVGDSA